MYVSSNTMQAYIHGLLFYCDRTYMA
jgi:hypothetical protein